MKVTPDILKAFGFKKLKEQSPSKFTHYNEKLEIYYSPKLHPLNVFAQNYTNAVIHTTLSKCQDIYQEIAKNLSTSDNP